MHFFKCEMWNFSFISYVIGAFRLISIMYLQVAGVSFLRSLFFSIFLMYELGWNQVSKATLAWFALQSWGACCIRCSYKLWAALEKSNKMEGVCTKFQKGFPLAWWCFIKNRSHCMDTKSCPIYKEGWFHIYSTRWSHVMDFQWRWSWKLACSGLILQVFFK